MAAEAKKGTRQKFVIEPVSGHVMGGVMADRAVLLDELTPSFTGRPIGSRASGQSLTPATCDGFHYLYQSVTSCRAGEILANNGQLDGPSAWGTERVARRRGEHLNVANRVLARVELRRFAGECLGVDDDILAHPLHYKLHLLEPLKNPQCKDDERARWDQSEGAWQDCLRITGLCAMTLRCGSQKLI